MVNLMKSLLTLNYFCRIRFKYLWNAYIKKTWYADARGRDRFHQHNWVRPLKKMIQIFLQKVFLHILNILLYWLLLPTDKVLILKTWPIADPIFQTSALRRYLANSNPRPPAVTGRRELQTSPRPRK